MKIRVYKSENALDIDETYETTLLEFLHFLRIDKHNQRIPKPNEKIIFVRRGNTPVQMWYEVLKKNDKLKKSL